MTTPPSCPGCGDPMGRTREPLCVCCWQATPAKHRRDIHAAQRDLGRNPTSPRARQAFDEALADAMGAAR